MRRGGSAPTDPSDAIVRHHADGATRSSAVYSPCEGYRYSLERQWDAAPPLVCVMLNPSTATERANDPTIARCEARARAGGFGGVRIVNLFAFRATDPRDLKRAADPVGPDNDARLMAACAGAGLVLAGWGVHGAFQNRAAIVLAMLRDNGVQIHTLGLTKGGHPRHPLYIGYATQPELWPR